MLIIEREVGDVVVVEPRGRLDVTTREEFYGVLSGTLQQGARRILLDLSGVSSIDSTAVGVLFGVYTSLRKREGVLRLANVGERVARLLEFLSLEGRIDISESVDEALEKFAQERQER